MAEAISNIVTLDGSNDNDLRGDPITGDRYYSKEFYIEGRR